MYYNISFPSLGISLNPSRVAFNIGSKPIYWYGIIIAIGFLLAVLYACRRAKQFGLTQDQIIDMLICAVPCAIVCARAYYVIFSWDLYRDDPIRALYIWEGGLAIYGGVIGAVIGLLIYTKVKKVSTLAMMDIGGLGLLIGQCIGRWGNFINREAFGTQTGSFLRMGLEDASGNYIYVHPTFLYESVWNALGLLFLHFYSKRRKYDGQVFVLYAAWYGFGRMFIEGLRTDSLYVPGTNLRISQFVAGLCVVVCAVILFYNKVFREHEPEQLYVNRLAAAPDTIEPDDSTASDDIPENTLLADERSESEPLAEPESDHKESFQSDGISAEENKSPDSQE